MNYANKIAIIGAGYSGTMVAVHLLNQAASPLTVYLIEPNPGQFGRGVAYSTDQDCHLLNVPAINMGAFPDDPGHFYAWAKAREKTLLNPPWLTEITPTAFLPRRVYGEYLVDLLNDAASYSAEGVRLQRIIDRAIAIDVRDGAVSVQLMGGQRLQVSKAVLAIGNFPPGDPWVHDPSFYQDARYFSNPWLPGLLPKLLETRSCLLIGSGLTMVDWVVALKNSGYQGVIHTVSRRGLRPQNHNMAITAAPLMAATTAVTVRQCLRQLRQQIQETGGDWRALIDSFRPVTQTIWSALPLVEQKRFLRHLRSYWDVHRHRLAPNIGQALTDLLDSGQLLAHVGRIVSYQARTAGIFVTLQARGWVGQQTLQVDAVVNCSGSESDYRKLSCPLVKNLLSQNLASPDALKLGLAVSKEGALLDTDDRASECLFTLGPPQKGLYWETTAVPEIRVQAAKLARHLLAGL